MRNYVPSAYAGNETGTAKGTEAGSTGVYGDAWAGKNNKNNNPFQLVRMGIMVIQVLMVMPGIMKNYPGSTGYAGRNAAKNYASTNDARNYACSGAAEPGSYGSNEAAGKTGNIAPSTYDANDLGTDAARAGSTYPAGHPFSAGAAFAGNQSFCCW